LLGELEMKQNRVVIADFEAGVGTMLRANAEQVDVAVVVVEPYMKSIEAARRLVEIASRNGI
jgi:CO dehydrogenase maturation factor